MAVSRINEAGLNVNQYGNRNIIINGAMKVAQRGTSTSITSAKSFSPDRFYADENSLDEYVGTISQDSDAPDGFSNSLKITTTTEETTLAADEYLYIGYGIEAQDLQQLKYGTSSAQDMTLSFWVKCSVTGTYCVGVYGGDGPRMLNVAYTINAANTWEYKTLKIEGDTGGTMNDDTGEGIRLAWNLSAGTDYQGTDSTSWVNYVTTAWANSQVTNTFTTTASSTFFLTGVQLEVGDTATDFEHRSYADEWARCRRYTQVYANGSSGTIALGMGSGYSATQFVVYVPLDVAMRAAPSVATSGNWINYYNGATGNLSSVAPSADTDTEEPVNVRLFVATGASTSAGAALWCIGGGGTLTFSAEL